MTTLNKNNPNIHIVFSPTEDADADLINIEHILEELDIPLNNSIIVIEDVCGFNGREMQGRYLHDRNVNAVFKTLCNGEMEFYLQKTGRTVELKGIEHWHNGSNFYTYRELKPALTDSQLDRLERAICDGKATAEFLSKYTKSLGKTVQEALGIKFDKRTKTKEPDR